MTVYPVAGWSESHSGHGDGARQLVTFQQVQWCGGRSLWWPSKRERERVEGRKW